MSNYYSYGDGTPERWDRERFERVRARSRGPPERARQRFEYDEYDRYDRRGDERRDVRVSVDERGPRGGRYDERIDIEEDRFSPRRSRPAPWEEERIRITERDRQIAPYRPPQPRYEERDRERDYHYDGPRERPQYLRRQSSLDTFDRPRPRYDENNERDVNVSINVTAPDPYQRYQENDYNGARIYREREVFRDQRDNEEINIYEESVSSPRRKKLHKSTTRCPKRLFHKRALVELGYEFDEDEFFWYIPYEIRQSEIDDLRTLSTTYFEEDIKISLTKTRLIEGPNQSANDPAEVIETVTTKIIENPTDEDIRKYGQAPVITVNKSGSNSSVSPGHSVTEENISIHNSVQESRSRHGSNHISRSVADTLRSPSPTRQGRRGRSRSRPKGDEIFEDDETIVIDSPMDLVLAGEGRKQSRKERDIKAEIRALEAEKKALKYEREADEKREKADRIRGRGSEDVEIREKGEVRVEKNTRDRITERDRSIERAAGLVVREPSSSRQRSRSVRIRRDRSRSRSKSRSRSPTSRRERLAKGLAFFTT